MGGGYPFSAIALRSTLTRVVALDRVLSMDQIEQWHLNCATKLFEIEQFDDLTVCKQMTDI